MGWFDTPEEQNRKDNENYARGVEDGQNESFLGSIFHDIGQTIGDIIPVPECEESARSRENYESGRAYGRENPASSSSDDDNDSSDDSSSDSSSYDYSSSDSDDEEYYPTPTAPARYVAPAPKVISPEELARRERKNIADKVAGMTSKERDEALKREYEDGKAIYNEPDERVRMQIINYQVMEKSNDIYGVIIMSRQEDETWREAAQDRLEVLLRKHPEVKHLVDMNPNMLLAYGRNPDTQGIEALTQARGIETEKSEEKRIMAQIDAMTRDEVYTYYENAQKGSMRIYALTRYHKMPDKNATFLGFLGNVAKAIFGK